MADRPKSGAFGVPVAERPNVNVNRPAKMDQAYRWLDDGEPNSGESPNSPGARALTTDYNDCISDPMAVQPNSSGTVYLTWEVGDATKLYVQFDTSPEKAPASPDSDGANVEDDTSWTATRTEGTPDSSGISLSKRLTLEFDADSAEYEAGDEVLVGELAAANFNSTADQAIVFNPSLPPLFYLTRIEVDGESVALSAAVGGVYAAASKTTALTDSTETYADLDGTSGHTKELNGLDTGATYTPATLPQVFLSLTTAQGSAATARVRVYAAPVVMRLETHLDLPDVSRVRLRAKKDAGSSSKLRATFLGGR